VTWHLCKFSQRSVILDLPIRYQNLCTLSSCTVPLVNILFFTPQIFLLSPATLFLPGMLMASTLTFQTLSIVPNKPHHHHSTKLHPLPLISSRFNLSKDPPILQKVLDQSSNVLKTVPLSLTSLTLSFLLDQKVRNMYDHSHLFFLKGLFCCVSLCGMIVVETGCGTCC